ncbi:MAG: hypothetical protein HOO96_16675 [Polyangiaceae bacterium]|nr:hypothetical protein [Polyangiaceae bacterium]
MLRMPLKWVGAMLATCVWQVGCQGQGAPSGFAEANPSPTPAPVYVDETPPDAAKPPGSSAPDAGSPDAGDLPKPPVTTGLQYNGAIGFDRRLP